jgi:hypothetical protein
VPVKEVVQGLLWDNYIENDQPVVVFGTFEQYEQAADTLSKSANNTLIWALHGTPLALIRAKTNYLAKSDEFFRDHVCDKKVRLVVFEYGRDLNWYIKARRYRDGDKVPFWRRKAKLEQAAARVRAFEEAVNVSGKLLFTATDILDRQLGEYKYSKLDAGYISSNEGHIYCFHSPLSLRAGHPSISRQRQEKIIIFKLSTTAHSEIPARPFYHQVFQEVNNHPDGEIFFDEPDDVKKHVRRVMWPIKRTLEKSWNRFLEMGNWLLRNRSTVRGVLGWIALAVIVLAVSVALLGRLTTVCKYVCTVDPPGAVTPPVAQGEAGRRSEVARRQ